jgi:hypothetical protein
MNFIDKYIYRSKNSIPTPLCDDIIELFDDETNKFEGVTLGGVNKTIKDTTDFVIPKEPDTRWKKIEEFLKKELHKHLMIYLGNVNDSDNYLPKNNSKYDASMLKGCSFQVDGLMVQKYDKGKGKYIYHNDFHNDISKKRYRVITFLWYLNDVEEGGETEFWDSFKIKPEKGKIILFPSFWCFPHRGNMPISDNKYIITGWFYNDSIN